ncbi:unnamed protein product [Symbiodinium necroappetens]|uniref:Uncharacterized protein n=1 Tax=Symbiodinium necroappetens TaxID=1628268 RepID=A0A813ABK0_9DINO|nr:unnamed protein product [Symbiodinium necroappetens]
MFLDLASAYYGVVRETVLGSGLSGRSVESIAESLGLTTEDLQLLRHHVAAEPILQTQDAVPLLEELAREMHSSTWFLLAQDDNLVHTHRGTRPGGALADVLFNILFAKVLKRRDPAAFRNTVPVFPWDGLRAPLGLNDQGLGTPQPLGDVVYADDLATFVLCRSASSMRSALSGVASATLEVLGPHGLRPNYGPKKTAAIVALHGPGSRAARSTLFGTLRAKLPVFLEHSGMIRLDLVTHYRHLGSTLSYNGGLTAEIKLRLALGRAAFKEGRQRLFSCRQEGLLGFTASSFVCVPTAALRLRFLGQLTRHGSAVQTTSTLRDPDGGWVQCPATAGVSRTLLPAPTPVMCPALLRDLQALVSGDDQAIFDVVRKHIEPLPVLRRTLRHWTANVLSEALRASGEDVLLVLHAEHLCSHVSGHVESEPSVGSFVPLIHPVPRALPIRVAPVRWIGRLCPAWAAQWGVESLPSAPLAWPLQRSALSFPVAALCCCPPSPPFSFLSVTDPAPGRLRHLRANRGWFVDFLSLLEFLLPLAQVGVPVLLRVPCPSQALGPVAEWLLRQAMPAGSFPCCFTLEFN